MMNLKKGDTVRFGETRKRIAMERRYTVPRPVLNRVTAEKDIFILKNLNRLFKIENNITHGDTTCIYSINDCPYLWSIIDFELISRQVTPEFTFDEKLFEVE